MTDDAQPINVNASPADKIAYMQNLLDTLRDLDRNKDLTVTTGELADERIRNYIKYRDMVDRNPSADPLKELRSDLIAAISGDAVAHDNVVETLRAIQAHDQKPLQQALDTAAKLTGKPRDAKAEEKAADLAASAGDRERTRQELQGQLGGLMAAHPEMSQNVTEMINSTLSLNPHDKNATVKRDSNGVAVSMPTPDPEAGYKAMVAELKVSDGYTPQVDAALRTGMGLPPKNAEVHKGQNQQEQIADLGKQLAQYKPEHIEASPGAQQLSAAVDQASRNGRGGR